MKRLMIFLLPILCLSLTAGADVTGIDLGRGPTRDADFWAWRSSTNKGVGLQWMDAVSSLLGTNLGVGTGNIYYVDSNVTTEGDGSSWEHAKDTLAEAVALCTANNGDLVRVAEGHAENLSAATTVKITTAGVTVVGQGIGSLRPTFTTTATGGVVHLNAANVAFVNCNIVCGITNTTALAKIQGDYSGFYHCSFYEGGADGDMNGVSGIVIGVADNDSDYAFVDDCTIYLPDATTWAQGIQLAKDHKNVSITNTRVIGDFSNASIDIPAAGNAQVGLLIDTCWLENHETGDHSLQVNGTGNTGLVSNCTFVTDGTYLDAGGLVVANPTFGAYATDSDVGYGMPSALWTLAAGSGVYPTGVTNDSILALLMSKSGTAAASSYDNTTDSLEALSDKIDAVDDYVDTEVAAIKLVTDDLAGISQIGDKVQVDMDANSVPLKAVDPVYGRTNHLAVDVNLANATWNTVATHEVFTVTGTIRCRLLVTCSESVLETDPQAANGTIQAGIAGTTDAFIAATAQTAVDTGEIWHDNSPDASAEAYSVLKDFIVTNGVDIGYELAVEAATDGTVTFHLWWEPLDATGAVVAGPGTAL